MLFGLCLGFLAVCKCIQMPNDSLAQPLRLSSENDHLFHRPKSFFRQVLKHFLGEEEHVEEEMSQTFNSAILLVQQKLESADAKKGVFSMFEEEMKQLSEGDREKLAAWHDTLLQMIENRENSAQMYQGDPLNRYILQVAFVMKLLQVQNREGKALSVAVESEYTG